MLELEDHANEFSRLGCQVKLTPELDGLIVKVVGR
jgi:2Fe-2S ferredoxin